MDDFEKSLAFVLKWEGGYSDDPEDSGGATKFGITHRVYQDWNKRNNREQKDIRDITVVEAKEIYLNRYWILGKADKMPLPLCLVHFDSCVNTGIGQASKFLQRAIGADDDGIIGPNTLASLHEGLNKIGGLVIANKIIDQRERFYENLVKLKPSQEVFLKGWLNRTKDLRSKL